MPIITNLMNQAVFIRVRNEEKQRLVHLADEQARSLSGLIRFWIRGYLHSERTLEGTRSVPDGSSAVTGQGGKSRQ